MTTAAKLKRSWGPPPAARSNGKVIDLERYAPAYLTFVANKLGRGASRNYLRVFNVGVETWRWLVFLAIHGSITARWPPRRYSQPHGPRPCYDIDGSSDEQGSSS